MQPSTPAVSVFGHGRFGQLVVHELTRLGPVGVHDPNFDSALPPLPPRAVELSFDEAARARVLLLAIPIRAIETALRDLAPLLQPGALVIDTSSVKVWPMRWMEEILPRSVDFLGTHPLFGPDSAASGWSGQSIVLVEGRSSRPWRFRRFLAREGLRVLERTAEAHDREMAETQALVHWLGRGLSDSGVGPREAQTLGHRKLCEVLEQVTRDTPELFEDLERWNPYASEARARLLEALQRLDDQLGPSR